MIPAIGRPSRRAALALFMALACFVAITGTGALAGSGPSTTTSCTSAMRGTYYSPSDYLMTLNKDGSLVGQFSKTTQEAVAGLGESFSGQWSCSGSKITLQEFRFDESNSQRQIERGDANWHL